jgi:hypothetical protein
METSQGSIYRGNNYVETPRQLLQRIGVLGIVNEMRAKLFGFRFLAVACGESVDLAAPFVSELQRHVAQSTDGMNFLTLGLPYKVNDLRAVAA